METLIHALIRLIHTISRNFLSAAILLTTILLLGLGLFAHFNLQHLMARFPTVSQEQQQFDRAVILNDLIITELQDMIRGLAADRANVNQFKNGQFDLAGVPYNFSNISFSAAAAGVSLDDRFIRPVPMSVYNDIIPIMWREPRNPVCITRDIEQITNPVLRFRLQDRGTQVLMACPIMTPGGAAVGFLSVEYLRREARRPSEAVVHDRLRVASARIANYLLRTTLPSPARAN